MNEHTNLPEGAKINEYLTEVTKAKALGQPMAPVPLDSIFAGKDLSDFRKSIREEGVGSFLTKDGQQQWVGVELDSAGNVMSVAAAIPRTPSKAQDFLNEISDFKINIQNRNLTIQLFRRIYLNEGLVNNAVNKVAALIATNGSFKVRRIKGVKGKGGDKMADEFLTLLNYWLENVNSPGEDNAVTGGRGMQSFISQGVRTALIEGDHFARSQYQKVKVPVLKGATYSMPMNIQTYGGDVIQIPDEAAALGLDWIYWVPPKTLINALDKPKDKDMKAEIDKLISKDVQGQLKKTGKYRLDSSLMAHIKHRAQMTSQYGESFIQAAMSSIAYKRSLQALDIVTIENLLNRLLILSVGSDKPESVYHKQEVTAKRVIMLQNMMKKIGPSSTLVWAGPDLTIQEAGAHGKILEMDGRYATALSMIRTDLGTPSALLTGEGADGKSSAIAAITAVAAQIQELQGQYAQTLRTWAQRIAIENKFEDVDVTWVWEPNPLINKAEVTTALLGGYQAGAVPLRVLIEDGYGGDFEAWEQMMADEVTAGYREKAFGPPLALVTTNPAGTDGGGGGTGRPTNTQRPGKPDPRTNKDTNSPVENK